jgi:type IV pilus assembly protein PilN
MIKINLLPTKRKKKAKPIPTFLISTIAITVSVLLILLYLVYFFNSRVAQKQSDVKNKDKQIADLKEKIKAVEDYEKRNTVFQQRNEIIEQLSKNRAVPVKILDEISELLPVGVWINTMEVKSSDINLGCTAFTNTDVVNYVNNLKNSKLFTDVFLQESVQAGASAGASGLTLYTFKLTFKVKA